MLHFGSHGEAAPAKVAVVATGEKQKEHASSSIVLLMMFLRVPLVSTENTVKSATGTPSRHPSSASTTFTTKPPPCCCK